MKYSFRLYSTGPKTKIKNNWDLPLNLQACPKCKTLNHKMAALCSKCGHSLSASSIPASNPAAGTAAEVAPAAATEHEDLGQSKTATIQEQIPDTSPPSIAMTSNASAAQAAPPPVQPTQDMPMANRQFAISNEQKWLRRAWGGILLASVLIALLIVIFSLQQPSAPPYTTKTPGNNASMAIVPPVAPMPAVVEQQLPMPLVQDKEPAAAEPVVAPEITPVLAEPEPLISPPLSKQRKRAALPRTTKFTGKQAARTTKKPARIHAGKTTPVAAETPKAPVPRPREPVAPANTPCSEAARALALCNTN